MVRKVGWKVLEVVRSSPRSQEGSEFPEATEGRPGSSRGLSFTIPLICLCPPGPLAEPNTKLEG